MDRRTLLAVGLMLLVAVVPALLMRPDRTAAPGPTADTVRMAPAEIAGGEPQAVQPPEQTPFEADVLEEAAAPLDQAAATGEDEETVSVESELYRFEFSTRGARRRTSRSSASQSKRFGSPFKVRPFASGLRFRLFLRAD